MSLTKVSYSMINGEVANILDFGASPSATAAVNAAAIQAAINSFGSNGGKVYIPKGTYDYDTTITLADYIEIIGENQGGSVLRYTGLGNGIQTTQQSAFLKISDFTLLSTNPANIGIGIKWGHYERHGVIENMLIRYFGVKGIEIRGGLDNIIRHCCVFNNDKAKDAGSVGIHIQPNEDGVVATTTTIEKCYVSSQQNNAGTSAGIRWDNVYMGYDVDNIHEVCDVAKVVNTNYAISSQQGIMAIIRPYYEANTKEIEWYDCHGYYVQGIGQTDPNTIASWDNMPSGFRYIWYQNNPTAMADHYSQFGSVNVNGTLKTIYNTAVGINNRGDEGFTWDPYSKEVNVVAPTLTNRIVTLPSAIGIAGWKTTVIKSNDVNTQTLTPYGSETISGKSSYVLNHTGEHVSIISDGANWFVIGSGGIKQPAIPNGSSVNDVLTALRNYGIIAP